MTKLLEDKLIDYWMGILPELENEETKLDEHFKKYLSLDTNQAIQGYYNYSKSNIDLQIKNTYEKDIVEGVNNQLFSTFFQQILVLHQTRLSNIIQNSTLIFNKREFTHSLNSLLYKKMFAQGYLVLVNELNLYRENQQLKGVTEEEQLNYFSSKLITSREFLKTLNTEYPTFLDELSKTVESTLNYIEEIIGNTERNIHELEEYFSLKVEKSLKEIQFMGDLHNGGKSVCTLIFNSGKLIYKPKSLRMEKEFQNFVRFINSQISRSKLFEMKIVTNENYGWCEFITPEKCKTIEETKRCYHRTGKLLALLYSLNGVDFHYENVIFKGEFPVLVDLETLFSVPLKDNLSSSMSAFVKASDHLRNSVLSIGLLPTKMKLSEKNAVSIGVLDAAQTYEVSVPSIDNITSSKMKISFDKKQIQTGQSSFTNDDKGLSAIDFLPNIKDGFIEIYDWIANNQESFKKMVTEFFRGCHVRIIVKPTMVYSQLISAANHPDFLTRNIHRKVVFSRVGLLSENELIARNEIYQLERNDIPYFFASFHKKNLYSLSNTVIENALYDTPEGNFLKKINSFSNSDLKRQLNFIDSTFFKKDVEKEITPINKEVDLTNRSTQFDYYRMAVRIGNLIRTQAIFGEVNKNKKDVIWLDTNVANMDIEDWTPEVTSYDLYNGISGLAIFFMNLDKVSQSHDHHQIIETIIDMLKTYVVSTFNKKDTIQSGIMNGISGIFLTIFEYSHLYQSVSDETFVEENINKLKDIINNNNPLDFVGGNVGALSLMIKILKKTKNKKLLTECNNIADLIIYDLTLRKDNLFEPNPSNFTVIYSGFSHGLSGLINYLYEYYKLTNKSCVYQLFKECLDYQRTNFWSSEELDWFVSNKEQKFAYGWCHGSPGILIEKLTLKKLGFLDEILDKEISYASNKLIENLGTNVSMCHGDIGNLLILDLYAKLEKNENAKTIVKTATNSVYQFIDENLETESKMAFKNFKGLMLGIAGIGDFMLKRYAENNKQDLIEYLW
jgi:type 2 lantibiotic biosynthesis protein LanM